MNFTFEGYRRQLEVDAREVTNAVEQIRRTVKLWGPRLVQHEINRLAPRQPVFRGVYRRSFRFEDIPGGAVAYNSAPYASIIELGRRPGKFPPISVIMQWVRRKKIGMAAGPRAKGSAAGRRLNDREVRRMAFVIARAIAKRGLPARMILENASHAIDRQVLRAMTEERAA